MKSVKTINKTNKSKSKTPLVSVVMPVYNAADYLSEAIESILNQTYQNFEFIIINDASTDSSLEIVKKYKKINPQKIKIINIKRNLNCGGDNCANQGIKIAKGKYIARMDADDIAHPTRLEKQVEFLENNQDIFLVGSNAFVINKNGETIGEKLEPEKHENIKNSYFTFHPLIHPSCMYKTLIGKRKFRYQIKYSANNDYYTFFKLLCKGFKFANLSEKLIYFRIHGKNDTFVNMKEKYFNTLKARIIMVKKFGYKPSIKALAMNVIETMVVFALPEKVLTEIYLFAKGIKKFNFDLTPSTLIARTRFALGI